MENKTLRERLEEASRKVKEKLTQASVLGSSESGASAGYTQAPLTDEQRYATEVERMVRMRYSLSDELGLLRQRESKHEEFAEYYAYVEKCKAKAKAALKSDDNAAMT